MDEPKKFLADRLLSQERPITYRELSRALNVHVNIAKGLLYDFHKCQNALRADSIHATYLLAGIKSLKAPQDDAHDELSSSAPENLSEPPVTKTVALVGEDRLEDRLREYREVTSIHIYSLAASRLKDVALLADIANSVSEASKNEGSSDSSKYGAIPNPLVRRRRDPRGRGAPTPVGGTSKPVQLGKARPTEKGQGVKAEQQELKDAAKRNNSSTGTSKLTQGKASQAEKSQAIKAEKQGSAEPSAPAPAPAPKRSIGGSIMQSFAKAASKPRSQSTKPAKEVEAAAALSDDGEADDSDVLPPSSNGKSSADIEAAMKSRKVRQDELKRMMEEDDDDDELEAKERSQADEDEEMEDVAEPEPEPQAEQGKESPAEEVASTGNGRRRGRRRVMKKKRMLDEHGYMVTVQEAGWESFSEEDCASQPPAKKPAPSSSTPSATSGAKGKKPAGKAGRGNIMSFFSKK
ncbi:hypothetical protein XA68_12779 [Ophiocordyceps unilateralis]|uniref:DNA polymerase delta subunit 3 n=1 Tax=Ophiocordyceps unilateralis TaxID=268505 RepID=A0A2A9PDY8_OPHUN|nr:hypothetical protein XA68_12779 [Ophiocordyceps unilateralis]